MKIVNAVVLTPAEEEKLLQEHFDTVVYANDEREDDDFPEVDDPEGEDDGN